MLSLAARSALPASRHRAVTAAPDAAASRSRSAPISRSPASSPSAGSACARQCGEHGLRGQAADGPHRAARTVTFAGDGTGPMARERRRLGSRPVSPRGARALGVAAVSDQSDARLVLRVSGPRVRDVLAKGVPVDLHPRRSSQATSRPPWSPTLACSSTCWTMPQPISSPRRAAWRAASGHGFQCPPPSSVTK